MFTDNGAIQIDSVREDGVAVAYNTATPNYTFVWTKSDGTVITPAVGSENSVTGLLSGTYRVTATNVLTGCKTSAVDITVDNISVQPLVVKVDSSSLADTWCTGGNGTLSVTVKEGAVYTRGGYDFKWYSGTTPGAGTDITATNVNAATPYLATGLTAGDYSV